MMRLRRLDLTRFGHFTGRSIDFGAAPATGPDFHIIHGPNEAGKTTLMEAYLRLIFGFPHQEPYDFKHKSNTIQVGGLIEIDGVATELVRLKRNANSLLNQHNEVIPETVLQSCLGGIAQDDYRKLFCLDDATIEAGGEEITNSKGDFGRLLFAAAAGIGNLTGVLDQVAAQADAFYRKGASKTAFAGLKRDLDAVTGEIRAMDVSASAYHGLKAALEAAETAESKARAAKDLSDRRKAHLAAIIAAHPIAADLREAVAALAPTRHYPKMLDIDPEALVEMVKQRVALEAARDQQSAKITEAEAARADLILRPDIILWRDEILALADLRGRMQGAATDLPVREAERAEALTAMRAKLTDLGFDPGADPTRFVLANHLLRRLEQLLQDLVAAETGLGTAQAEQHNAAQMLQVSAASLADAVAGVTIGPQVTDLLTRFDAANVTVIWRAAGQQVAAAATVAAQTLRALAPGCAVLPEVTVTLRQIDTLSTDMLKGDQHVASLRATCKTAAEKLAKARARLGVLTSADLVTGDLATISRSERDQSWALHRVALDGPTADRFAAAMHRDDSTTTLRQAQTRENAEYQQALIAAGEAEIDALTTEAALAEAVELQAGLTQTLANHLAALTLPAALPAADLADWLRRHDLARKAQDDLATAMDLTQPARDAGEALRHALAALPGFDAGADLEAQFRMAMAQAETRRDQLAQRQSAQEAQTKDTAALEARHSAMIAARTRAEHAQADWTAQAAAALPQVDATLVLRQALPGLRGLRELNETLNGFDRQIAGMTRDHAVFVTRLSPLGPVMQAAEDETPLDISARASTALTDAAASLAADVALQAAIAAARAAHAAALSGLAVQNRQIAQLSQVFAPEIPTETLQDLRQAVSLGARAIDLRHSIARLTTALTSRLASPDLTSATAALAAQPLQDAEADLATLTDQSPGLSKLSEEATTTRIKAGVALDAVLGDAEVARRVASQRLIEVQMQDGTLRYLEDRFAHMLAERAIRRYRDTHRGTMLVATEAAFRTLTDGAYDALSTQISGQTEVLVATQTADGSTKQARDMSKGTRFQLYLALRTAAYEQVAKGGTVLPFFCDDIFETFDENRTAAACNLMRQIGLRGQAIYLTHHQHVVDIARRLCGDEVRVHDLTGT